YPFAFTNLPTPAFINLPTPAPSGEGNQTHKPVLFTEQTFAICHYPFAFTNFPTPDFINLPTPAPSGEGNQTHKPGLFKPAPENISLPSSV
ncbi:MAG TPA: hypothetical protein VK155_14050, partial [Bacteroidales bacterium]|nr:hypothetical protein [Bacteroidales bacterium]